MAQGIWGWSEMSEAALVQPRLGRKGVEAKVTESTNKEAGEPSTVMLSQRRGL